MSTPDHAESDPTDTKELRYEHPSGWLYLMRHSSEGLHLIIDTLLSAADREFTQSELAESAGVSRHTVRAHLDTLTEHGIVRTVANGKRYRFNLESPVTQEICALNSAVNAVGADQIRIDEDTGRLVEQ